MVTDSVDSFVRKDLGLAEAVISSDDVVDDLFLQVREELIRRIGMGDSGEVCIDLLMSPNIWSASEITPSTSPSGWSTPSPGTMLTLPNGGRPNFHSRRRSYP